MIENHNNQKVLLCDYGYKRPKYKHKMYFSCANWIHGWVEDDYLNLNHRFHVAWYIPTGEAFIDGISREKAAYYNLSKFT